MSGSSDAHPFTVDAVRRALEGNELLLVYQPIFDLQSSAFVGVEALIRWRHPELGLLAPESFIDLLEESDLVGPVARWTIETACAQGATWHDAGYRFRVSVNVSARQWALDSLVADVREALALSRFEPSLLVLELSRETVHDDAAAAERLGALAALGVHRAVDDFVPGPGALETLAALGVDVVKIDRVFVAESAASDEAVVVALVAEAEARGIQVIAAGIEDAAQREHLASERIASGQGYHLSRPYEAEEIDRLLEDFSIFSGKPL